MSDKLVPLLTGATRHADEYLWTLLGLRWARQNTGSSIDATLFNSGFAPFERALKQYWFKCLGRKSGGINIVRDLCAEKRPDVRRPILVDQRATGLLGNYIVSLRGMGLVETDSLRVVDDVADRLLLDIKFAPPRAWTSSWGALTEAFAHTDLKKAQHRLGDRLFGVNPEMTRAARALLHSGPKATAWAKVRRQELDSEQACLARATSCVVKFEMAALDAFGEVLRGAKTLPASTKRTLRLLAGSAREAAPFPSRWAEGNPLRSAIHGALSSLVRGQGPATTLLQLHLAVTREVRKTKPWIEHLGESPAGFEDWQRGNRVPDFRFSNLRTLVHETKWRPVAS